MTETYGYDKTPTPPRDYDASKVPAEIKKRATWVKTKFTGEDVAEAYGQAMEITGIYSDEAKKIAQQNKVRQDALENQFDAIQRDSTGKDVVSSMEIVAARGGKATLGQRLDETAAQLAQTATKEELNQTVGGIAEGTPLFADSVSEMTNQSRLYVNTSDGMIYRYNGSIFVSTEKRYQSTGLAEGSVTTDKTDFATAGKNMFDKTKRALGMFMSYREGVIGANEVCDVSDYIKIFANQSYTINKARNYCLFGTDKVYIAGVDGGGSKMTFTPEQDGYMRFTVYKTDVDSAQVEQGTTITTFEPYGTAIKNLSINDKSIAGIKLMDSVRFDAYPFQPLANFNANLTAELEIKKAIKMVELFGADNSKKYCLGILQRNFQSYGTGAYIYECNSDGSTNKIVSLTSKLSYIPPTGIDVFTLAEYQSSGISAKIYIDWSQITDGTQYVNTHYDKAGLDYRVYKQLTVGETAKIKLSPTIPAIVGKEINVYFDNVILVDNLADYKVEVACDIGNHQNERWTVVPSTTGTYPLSISLYKNGEPITSATTSVVVKSATVGNGVAKKALFIGDSTTDAGTYTGELVNSLFGNDVMNLELLGTRGTSPNLHEGRAGWRASHYVNDNSVGGVVNAFYNNGFDFSYYMTQQGYTSIDVVGINLGINDVFNYADDTSALAEITNVLNRFDTMLNSVKSYNTNTKVAFLVTVPPSKNQDAFGKNYGNGQTQWRYKRNNFLFVEKLIDKYKNREGEGIYLVPVNVNLDTENNMMTETVQVNSRNTKTVVRQSNGVHPDPMGYKQMSDVIYYWFKSLES